MTFLEIRKYVSKDVAIGIQKYSIFYTEPNNEYILQRQSNVNSNDHSSPNGFRARVFKKMHHSAKQSMKVG